LAQRLKSLQAALADRYAIERELGAGGMATVYLARDLKHDRPVALKVLRPELAAVLGGERFLREIRITARLNHPHILPLLDSGGGRGAEGEREGETGFLYYVMPYVEGESLRQRLVREGQLPLEEALALTRQVAAALDCAHARGIVHRDIKPENILLSQGQAVVADFGIALAVRAAAGARLTETGLSLGTPQYMSPEQAAADREVDARSDVYSLGAVLYEMLAGEPPHTGPTVEAILAKLLTQAPTPPRVVRAGLPEAVNQAVLTALATAPADRFRTAAEFAAALGAGRETPAAPAASTPSIAVLPFQDMSGDPANEYFSDGLAEDILDALTQVPGLRVMARTSSFAFRGKDLDVREIGARLNVEHILEGSVRRAGSRLRVTAQLVKASDGYHLWSQRFDREMTDVFAIQDEISQAIVEKLRVRLAGERPLVKRYTENMEAYHLFLRGRHCVLRMTPESLTKGSEYLEQALALDPEYPLAHAGMAELCFYRSLWGFSHPKADLLRTKSAAMEALKRDETLAEAHGMLGVVLGLVDFDWTGAEREFRRALELNPASPIVRYSYGFWLLRPMGRSAEALLQVQRAVELDPLSPNYSAWLGVLYSAGGQHDLALTQYRRAIELDPSLWRPHWLLSMTWARMGEFDEAIAEARRACELSGDNTPTIGNLGRAYALAGRRSEAEALLEKLTARSRTEYMPPFAMALVHLGLEEWGPALDWLERGVEDRDVLVVSVVKSEPQLVTPLLAHPRYQALLCKMNLEL
jgi:eukaryotic-like serine/threonine-protein kinase